MICNTIGLTADSFETLYVHGGAEVPEVYGSINYAHPIFYSLKTLTGATSYSFKGYPSPLKSYEIGGNMVQTGTPTPTSPIYPQECGELEENVAIIDSRSDTVTNFYYTDVRLSNELPAGTYTVSFTMNSKTQNVTASSLGRGNKTTYQADVVQYQIQNAPADINKTITLNSNACIWARFLRSATPATFSYDVSKIAIVSGNKPYGQYKIPITCGGETKNIYLDEPLRKIGNYADVVNSDGTVTRRIRKRVLTGEETIDENAGRYIVRAGLSSSVNYIGKCTHFVNKSTGTVAWFDNKFSIESVNIFFGVLEMFDSIAAFRQLLTDSYAAGNPVTVWYVLTTPTTETITSPAVIPITGSNTLSIDTTLAPSSVSITGHVKPTSG